MTQYDDTELGQHWFSLVSRQHQAIILINVDFSAVRSCGIYVRAISQKVQYKISVLNMCLKLDMLTARRRLKSPRSLSGTSAHPTMVTQINVSYWLTSFSFHINQTNNSGDRAISKFDLETSKVKVMSEVKSQGHILYPVSNQCTSFLFHINQTNHSWDMAKIVFDLEKTHPKFLKKITK